LIDEAQRKYLIKEIKHIKERSIAVEKEIRYIRKDILSGDPKESMQRRMLVSTPEDLYHKKEKIDKKIKIEI
jgi:predicted  nucleic acid-binding Zn-ribbon protein